MKKLYLYAIVLSLTMFSKIMIADIPNSTIFFDDFSNPAAENWSDMKAWGFGVWQISDGRFISRDESNPGAQIYAALPKFEKAVLHQNYMALFRFRPVNGNTFQFSITIRQEKLDAHRVEIAQDGSITINKQVSGKWPKPMFKSAPGQFRFNEWQWLRLDVLQMRETIVRVKIWPGDREGEPEFYQAVAVDEEHLNPTNINFALIMTQAGGALMEIDEFLISQQIPISAKWRWLSGKQTQQAQDYFESGDLVAATQSLDLHNSAAGWNNLALCDAERGDFDRALKNIARAYRSAPDNAIIRDNASWLWYAAQYGGLLQPQADELPRIYLRSDRDVCLAAEPISVMTNISAIAGTRQITLRDSAGTIIRQLTTELPITIEPFSEIRDEIDIHNIPDGNYQIASIITDEDGQRYSAEQSLEIIATDYRRYSKTAQSLRKQIDSLLTIYNNEPLAADLANAAVELLPAEQGLKDCEQPGALAIYRQSIETALQTTERKLNALLAGDAPYHHQHGNSLRGYFSEIDSSLQGYAVFCPDKYQPEQPYPLVINLHGYDPSFSCWQKNPFLPVFMPYATEGGRYIVVNPFGRGNTMYQHVGENDVLRVLNEVKRLYNIDPDRVYLTGGSMGGCGTWNIGLNFADQFAAIAPIMGPTEFSFWNGPLPEKRTSVRRFIDRKYSSLSLAANALHLPVFCNHGTIDDIVPVEQSRKMVAAFNKLGYNIKYVEHPQVKHGGFDPGMEQGIYDWFEPYSRTTVPNRVVFTTGDLKHNRSYWLQIDAFQDLTKFARVEAEMTDGNRFVINTGNVARLTIDLQEDLVDANAGLTVILNERQVYRGAIPEDRTLTLTADSIRINRLNTISESTNNKIQKHPGVCGPIVEVFNSSFIIVYGTAGDTGYARQTKAEALDFAAHWREWQHVECRVRADSEIGDTDIETANLILIGKPDCNRIIRRINHRLPLQFTDDGVRAGQRRFDGEDVGMALIYPNPLNSQRYVMLLGGMTTDATAGIFRRIGFDFDYLVYDGKSLALHIPQGNLTIDGTPLLCGFFDPNWQLDPKYQYTGTLIREKIIPREFPKTRLLECTNSVARLSEFRPDSISQLTGEPQFNRTFWGTSFTEASGNGIGVFPNSELIYNLDGRWDILTADLAADARPDAPVEQPRGNIQFGIWGDGQQLFVSDVMNVNSEPQHIEVTVRGINELKLIVRTQDWLPHFYQAASWRNLNLSRKNGE